MLHGSPHLYFDVTDSSHPGKEYMQEWGWEGEEELELGHHLHNVDYIVYKDLLCPMGHHKNLVHIQTYP
jgi:hypothetical protein